MTIRRGEIWIAALDPTQSNWFLGRACERVIVVIKNESK
jgi:hypothetical protein